MSIESPTTAARAARAQLDSGAVEQLFTGAHTAAAFAPTPVTQEQQRAIHEMMRMPPTAMNTQPLRILWVRSPEARERLGALMSQPNRAKTLAAPLSAVLAYDVNWHEHLATLAPFRLDSQAEFAANEPLRTGMAQMSAHIQAGYFLLAARANGLDVGPMSGFDKSGVDREFLAEKGWHSFAVVNLGHPAADGAGYRDRQGRLSFEEQTLTL
ncbi:malonic semialdehyde reductase [Galactobacter caseinivorans]|uniref:malonic semialdehyde reductase n=1 Tax=Galactobacter caseinivorans TaxID=2676123 RepID=UPI001F3B3075|nr:malonic semialdehyde reductase [Galactobacter caseinivorans]